MKVCTDACLFGAWVTPVANKKSNVHFLDIGAGTGLLSLMLAQRYTNAFIAAAEIDPAAATQAKENFEESIWKDRLSLHHSSIQNFQTSNKYDCIISNPPFFEGDLKSSNPQKNLALHSTQLNFKELTHKAIHLLLPNGYFAVLLPFARSAEFEQMMDSLQLHQKILIKQTPKHNYFRSILIFNAENSKQNSVIEISIKDDSNQYTNDFKQLLTPYYLHL